VCLLIRLFKVQINKRVYIQVSFIGLFYSSFLINPVYVTLDQTLSGPNVTRRIHRSPLKVSYMIIF